MALEKYVSRKFLLTVTMTVTGCAGFLISVMRGNPAEMAAFGAFATAIVGAYMYFDNSDPHK